MFMWNRLLENATSLLLGMDAKDLVSSVNSTLATAVAAAAAATSRTTNGAVLTSLLAFQDSEFLNYHRHNRSQEDYDYNDASSSCDTTNNSSNNNSNSFHDLDSFCRGCSASDGDDYHASYASTTTATTTALWFFSSHANYYGWCLACFLISLHLLSMAISNVISCYQFVCAWNLINRTNAALGGSGVGSNGDLMVDWQDMLEQMEQDEEEEDDHHDTMLSSLVQSQEEYPPRRSRRRQPPRHVVLAKKRLIEQSLTTFSYPVDDDDDDDDQARLSSSNHPRSPSTTSSASSSSSSPSYSTLSCPICLVDFVGHDVVSRGPFCHHTFHQECITEWLSRGSWLESRSCPCCRQDMLQPVPHDEERHEDHYQPYSYQQQQQQQQHPDEFSNNHDVSQNDYDNHSPFLPDDDQDEPQQRHPRGFSMDDIPPSNDYLRLVLGFFFGQSHDS